MGLRSRGGFEDKYSTKGLVLRQGADRKPVKISAKTK